MTIADGAADIRDASDGGRSALTKRIAGGPAHAGVGDAVPVGIPLGRLTPLLVVATVVVIMLGILREFVVAAIGVETALQDLRHIALDAEQTLAAWYSSSMMLAAAALLFLAGLASRSAGRPSGLRRMHLYWFALAVLFACMSIDEAVSFHEVLITPLRTHLNTDGALYFAWVIPGAIFVAVVGALFIPFLLALPRALAAGFALSGGLFVGGALGMEFVGGYFVSSEGWDSKRYIAAAVIEESLEMIGLTVFLGFLVGHLKSCKRAWHLA